MAVSLNPEQIAPRWLKLRDAAAYSALGVKRLKKLAGQDDNPIVGYPDPDSKRGDWIFDRLSLDAYREGQAGQAVIKMAALDVARRAGL